MALAIIVLLIGVPIGVWMLLNPDRMWWALESWKYRDPEANEPSEAAYGVSSFAGALVILVSIVVAVVSFVASRPESDAPRAAPATTTTRSDEPPRATLESRPERRGALPVVGYRLAREGPTTVLDLSYLVPAGSSPVPGGFNFFTEQGCEVMREVRGISTGRVTADLQLGWTAGLKAKLADDDTCRVTGAWSPEVATIRIGEVRPDAEIVTAGAVVRPDGVVVAPPAADNAVPLLKGAP